MAKVSPIYRVWLVHKEEREEITEYVSGFDYEMGVESDNILTLKCEKPDGGAAYLADNPLLLPGRKVEFQFGFIDGIISGISIGSVLDVSAQYKSDVNVTIRITDAGMFCRRIFRNKVWKNVTTAEIVTQIAETYGISAVVGNSTKVWKELAQGNKSDFSFLKYLAKREAGGDFIFYINEETIYLVKRGLDKIPTRLYRRGEHEGFIQFTASWSQSSSSKTETRLSTFLDPFNKKANKELVKQYSATQTEVGGKYHWEVDVNRNKERKGEATDATQEPTETKKDQALSSLKDEVQKVLTATLEVKGDPTIGLNEVITVEGVAKRHGGNWFVHGVSHSIAGGGFITSLSLSRTAFVDEAAAVADKVNDEEGDANGGNSKNVVRIDVDGNAVSLNPDTL